MRVEHPEQHGEKVGMSKAVLIGLNTMVAACGTAASDCGMAVLKPVGNRWRPQAEPADRSGASAKARTILARLMMPTTLPSLTIGTRLIR